MNKTGRNDPCPCGSGKKFKQCCMNDNVVNLQQKKVDREMQNLREKISLNLLDFDSHLFKAMEDHPLKDPFQPEELPEDDPIMSFLLEWIILDYRCPQGRNAVELILEENKKQYPEEIRSWPQFYLSLYVFREFRPGEGVLLEDRYSGKVFLMRGSEDVLKELHPDSILITRLLPFKGNYYSFLAVAIIAPWEIYLLDYLLENIREDMDEEEDYPEEWDKFLEQNRWFLLYVLEALPELLESSREVQDNPPPELRMMLSVGSTILDGKSPQELSFDPEKQPLLEDFLEKISEDQDMDPRDPMLKTVRNLLGLEPDMHPLQDEPEDWLTSGQKREIQLMNRGFQKLLFPLDLRIGHWVWHDFCRKKNPVIRKEGSWAAALEFLLHQPDQDTITQKEIGERYGVSAGTVSRNSRKIIEFLEEEHPIDPREYEE